MDKYILKDLINVKRGMSLSGEYYSTEGDLIRLTLGNFQEEGGFKINTSKDDLYFTGPVRDEFILAEGDIITPLTEQVVGLLGATARIPESGKYIQSGDVALIKCISDKIDDGYCYYLISSDVVRRQLSAAAQQTKIRHTSPEKIMDCKVFIPEVNEQKKIAHLLDNINKKIELNNKINDNLQQLIVDTYNYWFVQFCFPNESSKPYKYADGEMVFNSAISRYIPVNWCISKISEICNTQLGGTPDTSNEEYWGGDIPWLNSGEVAISPIITAEKSITALGLKKSATSFSKAGAVLLSITRYIRPSVLGLDACYNQSVVSIEPTSEIKTEYLYPFFLSMVDTYMALRSGAQQPHINKKIVDDTLIPVPPAEILSKYYEKVSPILTLQIAIAKESKELKTLRDSLLPLLMSGQATIAD